MINETFKEFDSQFPDDEACKQYIAAKRWPNGVRCPRCEPSERIYPRKGKPFYWVCKNKGCGGRNGYGFSVTTVLLFSDTESIASTCGSRFCYLMLTAKKGISSLQVRRVVFGEEIPALIGGPRGISVTDGAPRCVAMFPVDWSGRSR